MSSYLADLHIHSTFSDGRLTIPQIVDLYGSHGYGAIAITDHLCETNTLWGQIAQHLRLTLTPGTFPLYKAILQSEAERAKRRYNMLVIPGFEITKNPMLAQDSAHILALGVSEWISADTSVDEALLAVRVKQGLSVAAHPRPVPQMSKQTYYLWNHRQRLESAVDVWEVANGKTFFDDVETSDLRRIACSDFHKHSDFSAWRTVLDCPRNLQAVFAAIRAQDLSYRYIEETVTDDRNRRRLLRPLSGGFTAVELGQLAYARSR